MTCWVATIFGIIQFQSSEINWLTIPKAFGYYMKTSWYNSWEKMEMSQIQDSKIFGS